VEISECCKSCRQPAILAPHGDRNKECDLIATKGILKESDTEKDRKIIWSQSRRGLKGQDYVFGSHFLEKTIFI
jgi:hypothetical protein